MHPIIHSKSSAKHFGGDWEDYIAIHNWLDSSKVHVADCRHRHTHHHDIGVERAVERFGEYIPLSNGSKALTSSVAIQHIKEDCGGKIPTKDDWFKELRTKPWMLRNKWLSPKFRRLGCTDPLAHAHNLSRLLGGVPSDYDQIVEFFRCERLQERPYTHHSGGIFDAEEMLGVGIELSNGQIVGTRTVAEHIVKAHYGRIPTMWDWIQCIPMRSFMSRNYELSELEVKELSCV